MLFVPPSIPYMVPEAEAAVIVMITDGPNGGDCEVVLERGMLEQRHVR